MRRSSSCSHGLNDDLWPSRIFCPWRGQTAWCDCVGYQAPCRNVCKPRASFSGPIGARSSRPLAISEPIDRRSISHHRPSRFWHVPAQSHAMQPPANKQISIMNNIKFYPNGGATEAAATNQASLGLVTYVCSIPYPQTNYNSSYLLHLFRN